MLRIKLINLLHSNPSLLAKECFPRDLLGTAADPTLRPNARAGQVQQHMGQGCSHCVGSVTPSLPYLNQTRNPTDAIWALSQTLL